MELYVVYFESVNYAGYGEHCLVWADSETEAMYNAAVVDYAEEFYREQDEEQFEEEHGENMDDVVWANIQSAELVAGSKYEEYLKDETQAQFYPLLNSKE